MKFYVKTRISENISETPEGFLLCKNVPLTHTGALHYAKGEHPFEDADEVMIRRESKELFSHATMASFEGKDITIQHPDEFVSSDNYQELTNGVMFNLRKSKDTIDVEGENVEVLICDFLIKTSEAIQMVKNGEREVSLGYEAEWELISKTEGRHSKIRGNHCALVQAGRAGKYCAINDHKKEKTIMDLKEKFKKIFGKSIDEAIEEKEAEEKVKDEDKDKLISDLEAKIADLEKEEAKDEDKEDEEEVKDEGDVESRIAKIESMLAEILSKMSQSNDESEEDEVIVADEDEDEDEDEEDGSEDEDDSDEAKDSVMVRAEILAPGIVKTKDVVKEALKKAYATADGKKVIDSLTSGKGISKLNKDSEVVVFNAAADALKVKRVGAFAAQKILTIDSFPALGKTLMTAEEINKKNKEHYKK